MKTDLKSILKSNGWSLARLGENLGLDKSTVSRWGTAPAERVVEIEHITGISRTELRPDLFEGLAPDLREPAQ
jgi:DNA-binding transcriptional regulator YdaS (Cro superfamily)